jgi:DNA-directed RNA polymerase specialized sigma24 family protein
VRDRDEAYCRWLAGFFYVSGYDRDDLAQEARLAMWLAPEPALRRLCAYRQIVELLRKSKRGGRPTHSCELLEDDAVSADIVDLVAARERLRGVLAFPLSELERQAVGRAARGEGCTARPLDNALQRARRKLAS